MFSEAGFGPARIEPMCCYWSTTGIRLAYQLHRLERRRTLDAVRKLLEHTAQRIGLDRLNYEPADAAGYVAIANNEA